MRLHLSMLLGFAAVVSACSSVSEKEAKLRSALDRAELSLSDSVGVAEAEASDGVAIQASLLVDAEPVFAVGALASDALKNVRIDIVTGEVLSTQIGTAGAESCPGSVSLAQAIAVAEAEVDGEAVSIAPDDDGHCNREVKVMSAETLWEVKVGPGGEVVETEEDDEG